MLSVKRLEMYQKLNTYKIDVSNKTIEEIVKEIIKVGDEMIRHILFWN